MPNRKPIAAALAALSLAGTGNAFAQSAHKNEIHVESYSWGVVAPSAVAAGDLATPGAPAVKAVPLTPLDDVRLEGRKAAQPYLGVHLENAQITSYQLGATPSTDAQLKGQTAGQKAEVKYYTITLTNARVVDASPAGAPKPGTPTSGMPALRAAPVR